ncbi:MAG: hypothetical protein QM820_24190 [Minicystis sp.]
MHSASRRGSAIAQRSYLPTGLAPEDIRLQHARYLSEQSLLRVLEPERTLVIRAQNSGDMYHMRAAMVADPTSCLLIWGVTPDTRRQAQQMVELHDDLMAAGQRVYYTDAPTLPVGFHRSETAATREIEQHFAGHTLFGALDEFDQALDEEHGTAEQRELKQRIAVLKPLLGRKGGTPQYEALMRIGRDEVAASFARRYAAYSEEEAKDFQRDLSTRGRFASGRRYVLVNYRATGHSLRPGANAPALDTGTQGMRQIMGAVTRALGEGVTVVPAGEEPAEMKDEPNLLNYWSWPSAPTRRKQLSLLGYLRDHFNVVGAIGMRSGVMDQIAFAGIPIISIDISPHRLDGPLPNMKPSKGWDRGLKLEDVYGRAYGRVFIKHPREQDTEKKIDGWEGRFHREDEEAITDSIGFYFGGGASLVRYRHGSHPLMRDEVMPALGRIPPVAQMKAYDLHHYVHPYLRHLKQHRDQMAGGGGQLRARLGDADMAVATFEAKARELVTARYGRHTPLSVAWMAEHQMSAVLNGRLDEQNPRGLTELRQALGFSAEAKGDDDNAVSVYRMYDAIYGTALGDLSS